MNLKERKDRGIAQIDSMKQVRDELAKLPDVKSSVEMVAMVGGGMRSVPIQLMVQGKDLDDLNTRTLAIKDEFAKIPGIVDADTSIEIGKPEVRIHIDRDKAANLGVSASSIGGTVNTMIGGEIVGKYKDDKEGERYDITARLIPSERYAARRYRDAPGPVFYRRTGAAQGRNLRRDRKRADRHYAL